MIHRALTLFVLILVGGSSFAELPAVNDGDIIFHASRSSQSMAIQRATGSQYSHMGMILHRDGKPFVFEAIATVRYTPLDQWIARGTGGRFVVKRLRAASTLFTPHVLRSLRKEAAQSIGYPYDSAFGWGDDRVYCSELVWKVYWRAIGLHIGELQQLRDFNLDDPVVQAKLRERYGADIPLDEWVIAPSAMFDSELLETVVVH